MFCGTPEQITFLIGVAFGREWSNFGPLGDREHDLQIFEDDDDDDDHDSDDSGGDHTTGV